MIHLTRINHAPFVLNSDRIEYIEATPDTVLTLTTGQKIVVLEPVEEVVRRVVEFRRAIVRESLRCPNAAEQLDDTLPFLPGEGQNLDPDEAAESRGA